MLFERLAVHDLLQHEISTGESVDVVYDLSLLGDPNQTQQDSVSAQTAASWRKRTLTLAKEGFHYQVDGRRVHIGGFYANHIVDTNPPNNWSSRDENFLTLSPRKLDAPGFEKEWDVAYGCLILENVGVAPNRRKGIGPVAVHVRNETQQEIVAISICVSTSLSLDTHALDRKGCLEWYPMDSAGCIFVYTGDFGDERVLHVSSKLVAEAESTVWSLDMRLFDPQIWRQGGMIGRARVITPAGSQN